MTSPFFIIEVIVVSCFLMVWLGGLGYLFGLAAAIITFWATKWDWSYFGLGKIQLTSSLVPALGYTLMIILINDILVEPWTEILTQQKVDITTFDYLHGNLLNLLIMLAIMWVMAAFGEEVFYRGYFMNRLAHLFGNNKLAWILAALLSSLAFGLTHAYQGISGMITTGIVGCILAYAFYKNRNNLLVGILTHGIYDTYGLSLIYFEKELVLKNMMIEIYQSFI